MPPIDTCLERVKQRILTAELLYGRVPRSVQLLAVSKTRHAAEIGEALRAGQRRFGESYLQEALEKIGRLPGRDIEWHFIGRIQSNKTRAIAENFHWVHSIDKVKQARRLNDQRPGILPPLNICLQIMIDPEESKGGLSVADAKGLLGQVEDFPRLRFRGLMTLPAPSDDLASQRKPFRALRLLRDSLATPQTPLETLSMGMSGDLEAAIAEGSTLVRVGTAIFGPRQPISTQRN